MKKKTNYLRIFIPLSLFSCVVIAGGSPPYVTPEFEQTLSKASVDSVREKNNLTLKLIEEKMKNYELKGKNRGQLGL